jgi:uncharacterized protein YjcR
MQSTKTRGRPNNDKQVNEWRKVFNETGSYVETAKRFKVKPNTVRMAFSRRGWIVKKKINDQ